MDRKRYVPAPEGLENRALLSTSALNPNLIGGTSSSTQDIPFTLQQKEKRIANLPFFIAELQPGRFLPGDTIRSIQNNLQPLVGILHPVNPTVLSDYNHFLRQIFPKVTLSQGDAHGLNRAFGSVLSNAGAPQQAITNLQANMNDLAVVDANSPNSLYLATNDYSLVLQAALGIGHPLKMPTAPLIALRDGVRVKAGAVTANPMPTLVGNYDPGGVADPGTIVRVIDAVSGQLYGAAPLQTFGKDPTSGRYAVAFDAPLSLGKHFVRVQIQVDGLLSQPGPAYFVQVVAPHGQ
jgi:hypothetical protein